MNPFRVLHIAAELAPLSRDSESGRQSRFLSRELAELGLKVTVVVSGHSIDDPEGQGLARRLTPLSLGSARANTEAGDTAQTATDAPGSDDDRTAHEDRAATDALIYEGSLPGGRVQVFVVDLPDDLAAEAAEAAFCQAVQALAEQPEQRPDIILATHGGERALSHLVRAAADLPDASPPAALFALHTFDHSPALAAALRDCDRVIVSSPRWAEQLRRDPDSHPAGRLVAPVVGRLHGVPPGIDPLTWNPHRDPHLPGHSLGGLGDTLNESKAVHKETMQRELGLRVRPNAPLIALIGPLDGAYLPFSM
ncbi:MAG: hypothetical protein AAGC55_16975, partial [Myxococcota bacterium]